MAAPRRLSRAVRVTVVVAAIIAAFVPHVVCGEELHVRRPAFADQLPPFADKSVADTKAGTCPGKGDRVACVSSWRWDFSQELCEARGCCYEPSLTDIDWCFNTAPAGPAANITKVHVVQGCHLDVGFAATAPEIVNRWFDIFFPLAYRIGKQLDEMQANHDPALNGTNARLRFTAQSWLISMYIDCPADWEGIHCPNATALAQFHESVARGWITWHAFPFNTEPEFYDSSMVDFAVQLTHEVDTRLGVANKTVMSQRDVPGMTRSIIPLLRKRNVGTISVGANGGSTPPNVPQAFIWKDPVSGDNVTALYLQGGYGGISLFKGYHVPTILPGLNEAMIVAWRGDNAGPPPNVSDVVADFEAIQKQFPGAEIVVSTFDKFAAVVNAGLAAGTVQIPTISSEIGDTWIHGTTSDPVKHGRTRIAQTLRRQCLASGECDLSDSRVWNFSRLLLKNGEHTWGLDVKSTLEPRSFLTVNWDNKDFQALRFTNDEYLKLEKSWVTQSRWGLGDAVYALGDHPLANRIEAAWKAYTQVAEPDTSGFTRVSSADTAKVFDLGRFAMAFDPATGAVLYLEDRSQGVIWVDNVGAGADAATQSLGLFEYHTHNQTDYTNFMLQYSYYGPFFYFDDYYDFDKPGIDNATAGCNAVHSVVHPSLEQLWTANQTTASGDTVTTFLVQLSMPASAVELAGAAPRMWVQYQVPHSGSGDVNVTLSMFNKTATRYPEAAFFRVVPCPRLLSSGASAQCLPTTWTMEKLDQPVDPLDVVVGGARHTHVVSAGGIQATVATPAQPATVTITSPDTGAVCMGPPRGFQTPLDDTIVVNEASSQLHGNLWDTNYIMWYGAPNHPHLQWRWTWTFDSELYAYVSTDVAPA